jgi:hypothetical protein
MRRYRGDPEKAFAIRIPGWRFSIRAAGVADRSAIPQMGDRHGAISPNAVSEGSALCLNRERIHLETWSTHGESSPARR